MSELKRAAKIFEEAGVSGLTLDQWCTFMYEMCISTEIHPLIERYLKSLGNEQTKTVAGADSCQDSQGEKDVKGCSHMANASQPTTEDDEDMPAPASDASPSASHTSLLPKPDVSQDLVQGATELMLNAPAESNDGACSLLVSLPVTSSDLSKILMDLQHECRSATIQQKEFFKQVLLNHRELQQELSLMRSTAESQANALKHCQEDLLAEFRCIPKSLVTGVTADKEIMSQTASAGNGTFNSESLGPIAADGTGKFCGHVNKNAQNLVPKEISENNSEFAALNVTFNSPFNSPFNSESLGHIAAGHVNKNAQNQMPKEGYENNSELAAFSGELVPEQTQSEGSVAPRKSKLAFEHFESECPGDQRVLTRLSRILRHKEFEFAIAFALLCNCLVMCWEAQYQGLDVGFRLQYPGRLKQADVVWTGAETVFAIFDWAFGMLFLFECLAKLACWCQAYFCDYWNILDFLCVLAFLFGKIARAGFNPHMLRLLRFFRLFRLVRLIRFLETLEALYVMTTAIAGMKRVLGWAIFLLTIMLLTCDLFLVQLLHATYFSEVSASILTEDQLEKHHEMYKYFGTCTRCMLSMFEITLGNWPPVARLLSEEVSEWFTLLCLVHKLTIGFAVVGVITGVILQETFKVAQTDDIIMLRQKRRQSDVLQMKLRNLFDSLDTNEDEKVVLSEFQRVCTDPNIKTWLASLDIETDDVPTLFHLVDVDHDGAISMQELLSRMPRIRSAARSMDVLALHEKLNKMIS